MLKNTGSVKLAFTWGLNPLTFSNSILFGNKYTAFGTPAAFDNCAFCENKFSSVNLRDPSIKTNRVVKCAIGEFSVSKQIFYSHLFVDQSGFLGDTGWK